MISFALVSPNPFDFRTFAFAKHGRHVVLVHFPIALFNAAVALDLIAYWTKRRSVSDAAYYKLIVAALATIPVIARGIAAWQLQLEGQNLKGTLFLHLLLGSVSGALICLVWWPHFRVRKKGDELPAYRFEIETVALFVVMVTAHLGGSLSGVNTPG